MKVYKHRFICQMKCASARRRIRHWRRPARFSESEAGRGQTEALPAHDMIEAMSYGPRPQISIGPRITPVVKFLIIANGLVFLWSILAGMLGGGEIIPIFGLTPAYFLGKLFLWQGVTYLFLHGGMWHIVLNMFALWMFGSELERIWRSRGFLKFYFVTGIGAGIFSVAADPSSQIPIIGASGAVYGILMAYGLNFPERYIYLYFLLPIKVKYFVAFLGAIVLISAVNQQGGAVAHVAHLGGMVVGFLYLKGWLSWGRIRESYFRWKLRRMRSRFRVYEGERERKKKRKEDDFWIN